MKTPETASENTYGTAAAPAREQEPDREARIAKLREQVSEGKYQVDAAELSSKIVDKHLGK